VAEPYVAVPTWTEVAASGGNCLLVVPLGSFEQHGPHLPLDTDTRVVMALVDQVAELPFVVVAPALSFGASGEHAGFPGTLSIGSEVLADVLVELVRSARATCAGVAFVCAHGGNADGIRLAKERARSEGDRVFVWGARVAGGDAHAGRTETSLMLAIAPDTVRYGELEAGSHRGARRPLAPAAGGRREVGVGQRRPRKTRRKPARPRAGCSSRLWWRKLTSVLEWFWSELTEPMVAMGPE